MEGLKRQIMKDSRGIRTRRRAGRVPATTPLTSKPDDSAYSRSNALKSCPGFTRN